MPRFIERPFHNDRGRRIGRDERDDNASDMDMVSVLQINGFMYAQNSSSTSSTVTRLGV